MYLDFYRLNREPFHITPDPDFLFPSPSHNEALASIVYGVEKRKGFVALTGEVGTGKTTILRAYLRREEGTDIRPIYLFHPDLSFRDLVIKLLRELGMETGEASTSELLERLQGQLIEEYRANRTPVLIIDEAQNMPIETLEQLRMLTNLETSKDKLLQVVLVGQPELEEILDQHSLRQLKQRISVRSTIQALTPVESAAYVRSRVERAGGDAKYLFTDAAIGEIVKLSNGIPRTINTLCDNSLIAGYGMQQRPVPPKTVREAGRDLQMDVGSTSSLRPLWAIAVVAAILAGAAAAYWYMNRTSSETREAEARSIASAAPLSQIDATQTAADSGPGAEPRQAEPEDAADPVPVESNTSAAVSADEPDAVDSLTAEMRSRAAPPEDIDRAALAQAPVQIEVNPVEPATTDTSRQVDVPPPAAAAPVSVRTPIPEPARPQITVTRIPNPSLPEEVPVISRVVQPGDCLSRLISDVYGTENYQAILPMVLRYNPWITDPDSLMVGLTIDFPESYQPVR